MAFIVSLPRPPWAVNCKVVPASKLPFDKVSADIKEALLQQELQNRMPAYFDRLKKEAGVQIVDPKYKLEPPKAADASKSAGK